MSLHSPSFREISVIHISSFPDYSVVLPFWPASPKLLQASFLYRLKPSSMCCWDYLVPVNILRALKYMTRRVRKALRSAQRGKHSEMYDFPCKNTIASNGR